MPRISLRSIRATASTIARLPLHRPACRHGVMPKRSAALFVLTVAAACCAFAADAAHAQSSNRPIKLVLPYTAGSPNDVPPRMTGPPPPARLGQAVVVDNRPGGGTSIGVSAVLNAEPDGTTLLFSNSPSHLIAPLGHAGFTYDPLKDFVPVAIVATSSNVIAIANSIPAHTAQDFVAYTKARPGKLNFGFGQGTLPQLIGEMFKAAAGIELVNVPYKGGARPGAGKGAVKGRRPGRPRLDRRPRAHDFRPRRDAAAAAPRRQAEDHRLHRHHAQPGHAGDSDHAGERLSRHGLDHLVRPVRA